MRKKVVFLVFCFTFSIFLGLALAAPTIQSVEAGSNGTLVIRGSIFGTKIPAAPILWETFQSGKAGDYLKTNLRWRTSGNGAKYTTSGYVGQGAYNGGSNERSFETNYTVFKPVDELYYSYMTRIVATGGVANVYKQGRMNSMPNYYNGPGCLMLSDDRLIYYSDSASTSLAWVSNNRSSSWQRHEMYKKLSTPSGTANGIIQVEVGPKLWSGNWTGLVTRSSGLTFQMDNILLPLEWVYNPAGATQAMYVDDVYVDNTRARVEIGNASTFAASTQREPQIPTAWSDNSISVNVNNGAFPSGSKVYLFVIDKNGVPSPGYPITLDGLIASPAPAPTSPTAPAPPQGLRIQ